MVNDEEIASLLLSRLLKIYGNINTKTNYIKSPLYFAIENNCYKTVKFLLSTEDIEVNEEDIYEKVLLNYAIKNYDFKIIDILLKQKDKEIVIENEYNKILYNYIIKNGYLKEISQPLNINNLYNGKTLFQISMENDDKNLLKLLLIHPKIDINLKNNEGKTAFQIAVEEKKIEFIIELMLFINDDINLKEEYGKTPLYLAIEKGNKEIIKLLAKHSYIDVNLNGKNNITTLGLAIYSKDLDIFKSLYFNEKLDINVPVDGSMLPLFLATTIGNDFSVKMLLNRPYSKPKEIGLSFIEAISKASVNSEGLDIFDSFISYPYIDVNITEKNMTPLKCAISYYPNDNKDLEFQANSLEELENKKFIYQKIIKDLLLNPNIDINLKAPNNETALCLAIEQGKSEVVDILISNEKIDINLEGKEGKTPINLALEKGNKEIVKLLLESERLDQINNEEIERLKGLTKNEEIINLLDEYKDSQNINNINNAIDTLPDYKNNEVNDMVGKSI